MSSLLVRERPTELEVYCKAWPVRNGTRLPKTVIQLLWEHHLLECPNQVALPFEPGGVVHLQAATCAACLLRECCTSSQHGCSVTIHLDEALPWELRQRQLTQVGRAKLHERVAVGHTFAHIERWQGRRARYRGLSKDLFDLCRSAMVHNWHVITRLPEMSGAEAA